MLVQHTREGRTAVLRLDNPPVNVMNAQLRRELKQVLLCAAGDSSITTIVITGEGKAFMAGADIGGFPEMIGKPNAAYDFVYDVYGLWYLLECIEKPTIAALNGLTLGAGLEMALCCDIRIAAEHVKIGLPEIKLGLFPGGGGTQRLARLIGKAKVKKLIFQGEPVSSQEALELGIVNRVVPKGEALALAEKINSFSLMALAAAKRAINSGNNVPLRVGIEIEAQELQKVFLNEDVREGGDAFLTKREPAFKNR